MSEPLQGSTRTAVSAFPFAIPEEAIEAAYDAADAQFPSSAQGRWLRPAIEEALKAALPFLRFSPMGDNHHNAAACPYCTPERSA